MKQKFDETKISKFNNMLVVIHRPRKKDGPRKKRDPVIIKTEQQMLNSMQDRINTLGLIRPPKRP